MYVPRHFRVKDRDEAFRFVRQNSFGLLVTSGPELPAITHLPMLLSEDQEFLFGHVALANPHWESFGCLSTAVFTGPHDFVSTANYEIHPSVATWNYTAVHLHGRTEKLDGDELIHLLRRLTLAYDPEIEKMHPEDLKSEFLAHHAQGVVGFKMRIEGMDAKYKLSQNKQSADRHRVMEAVTPDLAEMMRASEESQPVR